MPQRYDYRIAAGHDLPLGSLTNIQDIQDSNGAKFYPPRSWGSYLPGQRRERADGTDYWSGFPSCSWTFDYMTREQYAKLRADYCGGDYSGTVTIYTRTKDSASYERYNAVMKLPALPDSGASITIHQNVSIRMIRLEAL
jgi:hypothetical protein